MRSLLISNPWVGFYREIPQQNVQNMGPGLDEEASDRNMGS